MGARLSSPKLHNKRPSKSFACKSPRYVGTFSSACSFRPTPPPKKYTKDPAVIHPPIPSTPQTHIRASVAGDLGHSAELVIQGSRKAAAANPIEEEEEDKVHRLVQGVGEYDEIVAWLDWCFAKHDMNKVRG